MRNFKRLIGAVLLAGTIGVGTVAATAPAAHARTTECLAAAEWGDYVQGEALASTTWSNFRMWQWEYARNEAWIAVNC
ncbi:MAG: hypothetical protein ACRD12_03815 [Acidimicrobiales bacterium]